MTSDGIYDLPDEAYCAAILSIMEQELPASRAMTVVAYDNLRPLAGAIYSKLEKDDPPERFLDDFIERLYQKLHAPLDEINARRFGWFFAAALVARLDRLARREQSFLDEGAKVWTLLARSAVHIPSLLRDNIVWKDAEKMWYSDLADDQDLVTHVLTHTMPRHYETNEAVRLLKDEYDIVTLPRRKELFPIL